MCVWEAQNTHLGSAKRASQTHMQCGFGFSVSAESCVTFSSFFIFIFFCFYAFKEETKFTVYETNVTVHALFWYCLCTVHGTHSYFIQKNIKNGSHSTIYTFKNYFVTVFSVFNFSNNKFNPNGSLNATHALLLKSTFITLNIQQAVVCNTSIC